VAGVWIYGNISRIKLSPSTDHNGCWLSSGHKDEGADRTFIEGGVRIGTGLALDPWWLEIRTGTPRGPSARCGSGVHGRAEPLKQQPAQHSIPPNIGSNPALMGLPGSSPAAARKSNGRMRHFADACLCGKIRCDGRGTELCVRQDDLRFIQGGIAWNWLTLPTCLQISPSLGWPRPTVGDEGKDSGEKLPLP